MAPGCPTCLAPPPGELVRPPLCYCRLYTPLQTKTLSYRCPESAVCLTLLCSATTVIVFLTHRWLVSLCGLSVR